LIDAHHVLCGSTVSALGSKNQPEKDCAGLIHLNSSAGLLEKDQRVLGTGKLGPRRLRDWSTRSQRRRRESDQETPASSTKLSSLIVKITGAPMRYMIDWIVGADETLLDVAIDGLVAILGASFLTGVLHVIIETL
jgi:hypothetical protein